MSLPSTSDMSGGGQLSVSASALSRAPWGVSVVAGAVGAGLDLLVTGLHPIGATVFGVTILFIVAGIGAVLRKRDGRSASRALAWAAQHSWRYAVLPAVLTAIITFPLQLILTSHGLFGAAWSGIWHGAITWVLVGLIGMAGRKN